MHHKEVLICLDDRVAHHPIVSTCLLFVFFNSCYERNYSDKRNSYFFNFRWESHSRATLTHVKLKALVVKGVCAASGLIVLLQNDDPLACFGQERRRRQASHATADHHRVQGGRDTIHTEACREASQLETWVCFEAITWCTDLFR